MWFVCCERVDERQYVQLSSIEMDDSGQPAAFRHVLEALMSGRHGQLLITENARRAQYHDGLLVWTPVASSRYYYAPVAGKHFASPSVKCK